MSQYELSHPSASKNPQEPQRSTYIPIPPSDNAEQDKHGKSVAWGVELLAPAKILGLLFGGIALAVGHDRFYQSLDGRYVQDIEDNFSSQEWIGRYGTAFAFITKTTLSSAVALAYKQHIWTMFRRNYYSVAGINAMYGATNDIFSFLSLDFLWNAKIALVVALITWLIPLSALVTPSTLRVVPSDRKVSTLTEVPTINFDGSLFNFSGLPGNVAPLITRITATTASSTSILPMTAVASNASYTFSFNASSLECDTIKNETTLAMLDGLLNAVRNATVKLDQFQKMAFLYFLVTPDWDNLTFQSYDDFASGCITGDTSGCIYTGRDDAPFLGMVGNENITCMLRDTIYDLRFNSSGDTQAISYNTPYRRFNTTSLHPTAVSLVRALGNVLNGAIGITYSVRGGTVGSGMESPIGHANTAKLITKRSRVMETALVGLVNTSTPADLKADWEDASKLTQNLSSYDIQLSENRTAASLIEELSRNQTISLFSSQQLWSRNGRFANVTQTHFATKYEYLRRNLVLSYSIVVATAIVCVLIGMHSLYFNGVSHDTNFLAAMATTRNAEIDKLTLGSSLGALPVRKELLKTKIKFGVLSDAANSNVALRAGFGLPGQVERLKKGHIIG